MCVRRFLALIVIVTLIFVGGAFALYQWGGEMLVRQAIPKGHFVAPSAQSGPDYSSNENWLTRPGVVWPDNPVEWKPAGAPEPTNGPKIAALFYVHPTTYLERDRWNAPLRTGGYSDVRTTLFLQSQASAFSDVAEVWAPRYRQAAYGAFLLKSEDARQALDLAYRDVEAAFDQFIKDAGDRPIILAGHSQGALHLLRLLSERRDKLKGRLVAAYVVGWPVSKAADLPATGLQACHSPSQTGCLLSWMSFGEPANPDLILDGWEKTRGPTGVERRRKDVLCVNPITGTENGSAPASDNAGTLIPSGDLHSATLQTGSVGGHCNDGLLILGEAVPAMGPYVLPGNNYHVYDYALFWGSIRADAERRVAAWPAR